MATFCHNFVLSEEVRAEGRSEEKQSDFSQAEVQTKMVFEKEEEGQGTQN